MEDFRIEKDTMGDVKVPLMYCGELKHSALEITLKLADQDLCH